MVSTRILGGVFGLALVGCMLQMPAPAAAGGSVNIYVTPKGESADAFRKGFQLYSLYRNLKNEARVNQRGSGNAAGVSQSGNGNNALVVQRGKGHSATISQNGNDNAFGVFQFGKKQKADAAQNGNGNVGFLLQGGW